MKKLIMLLTAFCCLNAAAQPEFVKKVGRFIDSMSVKGVDRRYIDAPEKPWQVMIQGNINQSDLKMKSQIDGSLLFDDVKSVLTCEPRVKPDVTSYIGFWAGYRGYGLGYSVNVGGDKGSIFKIGATGGSYGVNLRIHRFQTDKPIIHYDYDDELGNHESYDGHYNLIDPMYVKIVTLDAYYLFNGKRFSYCAAYDQSVFQKRSAGSWLAGLSFMGGSVHTNDDAPAEAPDMHLKVSNISIGGGYGYNLVCHNWLFHLTAMPTIIVYNYNNITIGGVEMEEFTHFPDLLINCRSAIIYNISPRYFIGTSLVVNSSTLGHFTHYTFQTKWRGRLFFGFRL